MAVPKIVDADALEPGCLGATGHLVVEQVLGHGREYPRIGLGLHMESQVFLDLVGEEGWHRHYAVGLRGLRRIYDVYAAHAPVGLRDVNLGRLESISEGVSASILPTRSPHQNSISKAMCEYGLSATASEKRRYCSRVQTLVSRFSFEPTFPAICIGFLSRP